MMNCLRQLAKHGLLVVALYAALPVSAQRVSVKSNALYWATASPNFGVEFRLNRHLTLNLEGAFNRLSVSKISSKVMAFTPEMRYWLSARPQAGHFFGVMGLVSDYDITFDGTVHKGDAYGLGATYGYSFVLGKHWSMETTLGLGLLRVREKKFAEYAAEPQSPNNCKWIPAPIKAGVTFVYIIK